MARAPVLRGAWIRPGTHVDLIGAYKADMREADDALIAGGAPLRRRPRDHHRATSASSRSRSPAA